MPRHYHCLPLLLLLQITVAAQTKKIARFEEIDFLQDYTIRTSDLAIAAPSSAVHAALNIVDVRPDSLIGFFRNRAGIYHQIRLDSGFSQLANHLNRRFFSSADGPQITMYIKDYWVNEKDSVFTGKNSQPNSYNSKRIRTGLLKADFFLQKDSSLYPLYRFDTTIHNASPTESPLFIIEQLINASLRKLAQLDAEKVMASKKPTLQSTINAYYLKPPTLAILNDTAFTKGVYLSLQDFKMNKPASIEYRILDDGKTTALYTKNNKDEWELRRDIWGFSDGQHAYIFFNDDFCPLQKSNQLFYFKNSLEFRQKLPGKTEKTDRYLTAGANLGVAGIISEAVVQSIQESPKKKMRLSNPLRLELETGIIR